MDWTSVAVAGVALIGTTIGSMAGIRQSNRVVELRLCELEKKVDKHNNIVERMAVVERDIKSNCHRLDELEDVLPRGK